jgi:RNA-binding protein
MSLTSQTRRTLKSKAHSLRPVVIIGGRGITPSVLLEIDAVLQTHELIKIRVNAENREDRQEMIKQIIEHTQAEIVGVVGHVVVIYRKKEV